MFARLWTLVPYGLGMAGNGAADGGAVQDWLDRVFGQLQALVDGAVDVLAEAEPPRDVAEAEKRARAVGVIARTAKAVAALKASARKVSGDAEDDLAGSGEVIDEAEEQRLRAELFARVDRLFEVAEQKGYGPRGDPFIRGAGLAEGDAGDAGCAARAGSGSG
ncbi:hypothetical protein [Brevundimonas sp.]|uniref:hypothetical protein n=2 Tax=unclassified Brevundimonas TaxID=2622653 RepID=UPI002899E5A1|nr:hypothetical protein [Brevundimonas sp.]